MAVADDLKVYNEIVRSAAAYWNHPPPSHDLLNGWQDLPRERLRGMIQIQVKQQHPWTRGFIAVFESPYYAVTDDSGAFQIDSVPPGKYHLLAWHERGEALVATMEGALLLSKLYGDPVHVQRAVERVRDRAGVLARHG